MRQECRIFKYQPKEAAKIAQIYQNMPKIAKMLTITDIIFAIKKELHKITEFVSIKDLLNYGIFQC